MPSRNRSVVGRALLVLGAFAGEAPALTLSQLAGRTGLPLTTTHRLVADLVEGGALERRSDGAYVVGQRMWALGLLAPVSLGLRDVSLPFLQDLSATTGENAHIAVRDGVWALYVERISGRQSVPIVSRSGTRLPLHATAVGKVLLAHAPDDVVAEVLRNPRRLTDRTVVEPARLLRQLGTVRRRGYALTTEEMSVGTVSVAVPVLAADGQVLAALGVVAATGRREPARLVPVLELAARGIARAVRPAGR